MFVYWIVDGRRRLYWLATLTTGPAQNPIQIRTGKWIGCRRRCAKTWRVQRTSLYVWTGGWLPCTTRLHAYSLECFRYWSLYKSVLRRIVPAGLAAQLGGDPINKHSEHQSTDAKIQSACKLFAYIYTEDIPISCMVPVEQHTSNNKSTFAVCHGFFLSAKITSRRFRPPASNDSLPNSNIWAFLFSYILQCEWWSEARRGGTRQLRQWHPAPECQMSKYTARPCVCLVCVCDIIINMHCASTTIAFRLSNVRDRHQYRF